MKEPIIECVEKFIDVAKEAIKKGKAASQTSGPQAAPREDNSVSTLIFSNMKYHEKLKYPERVYSHYEGEINLRGQEKRAVYINYNGETLTKEELESIAVQAIAVRKYSLLAGIENAFHFPSDGESNKYLPISEQELEELLRKLIQQIEKGIKENNNASPSKQINYFVKNIAHELQSLTSPSKDEIYELIRKAEQYFVAHYHNQILINETESSYYSTVEGNIKENILQIDISHENKLTQEQKRDYLSIYGTYKPTWFTCLQEFEQFWLQKKIPKSLDDDTDWQRFEGLFKSSAMSHLPGIQNARDNYLFIKSRENKNYTLLSNSVKTSTMVQYYMPNDHIDNGLHKESIDRVAHTAEQVINKLIPIAKENFKDKWGNALSSTDLSFETKPLIYNQILLSKKGAAGDKRMADLQQAEIEKLAETYKEDFLIVSGNDPVNILRILELFNNKEKQWQHNNRILEYAKRFKACIQPSKLNPEQRKELYKLDQVCRALEDLKKVKYGSIRFRNYNAYKVALTEILVETVGGIVNINCKSGKDRTGLQELYHHGMLIYYDRYQSFPSFTEKSNDINRRNFEEILETLFYSLKLAESAAGNTPGSFGVKDTASMADNDFKKWPLYQVSNDLSAMNKPKVFINNEKKDAKRKKKLDKQAAKKSTTRQTNEKIILIEETTAIIVNKFNRPRQGKEKGPKHDSRPVTQISVDSNKKAKGKEPRNEVLKTMQVLTDAKGKILKTYDVAKEGVEASTSYQVRAKRQANLYSDEIAEESALMSKISHQ
jgi:hypothetical protein